MCRILGAVRIDAFLNSFPDVVAGFVSGLQKETGLVGDVLEVTDEGRTVFAVFQVFDELGVFRDAVAAGGEEVGKLLLKLGAGEGGR
jgi:hypothetical protein